MIFIPPKTTPWEVMATLQLVKAAGMLGVATNQHQAWCAAMGVPVLRSDASEPVVLPYADVYRKTELSGMPYIGPTGT